MPLAVLLPLWAAWKAAYLMSDGRVVDTPQQESSHSESQGYGLLLAATFADRQAFDSIFGWTEANLAIRADALLAWRWLPGAAGAGVPDLNNASDGDLFYAWALTRMAALDGRSDLLDRATAMATDLTTLCIVPHPDASGRSLLLPAAAGFVRDAGLIVNLSYYMPLAMRELADATGVAALKPCAADGEALMAELADVGLMPDWIEIGPAGMTVAEGMSDQNGYEALRIPLFLIWSENATHPAVAAQVRAYAAAASQLGQTPTVFDRQTAAVVETSAHVGYAALAALADCATNDKNGAAIPAFSTTQPYYPATLQLMALVAQITSYPRCMPL